MYIVSNILLNCRKDREVIFIWSITWYYYIFLFLGWELKSALHQNSKRIVFVKNATLNIGNKIKEFGYQYGSCVLFYQIYQPPESQSSTIQPVLLLFMLLLQHSTKLTTISCTNISNEMGSIFKHLQISYFLFFWMELTLKMWNIWPDSGKATFMIMFSPGK